MDTSNTAPVGGTELMFNELKRRLPEYLDKYSVFNYPVYADTTKPLIYWNQLSYDQAIVQFLNDQSSIDQIDKIVFVSHWQSEKFREKFKIPGYKTAVIQNACIGVDAKNIIPKSANEVIKICYTSTPWRGLDVLLSAWEIDPPENCELHIFSSTKIYGSEFANSEDSKYFDLYNKALSLKGVVYRGSISNDLLRKELTEFDILAYPCTFEETSCISVIEALSAGLRVITSNIGALPETTEGWARIYPYKADKLTHAKAFAKILKEEVESFRNGSIVPLLTNQVSIYKNKWSWDSREKEWLQLFKETSITRFSTRNSWDAKIFDDVYTKNEYNIQTLSDSDVVIDIGAHIGSFSKLCLDKGAGKVIAFEPFTDSFNVLVNNIGISDKFTAYNKAVWDKSIGNLPFQTDVALDPTNLGLATLFTKSANTVVDTVGIDEILKNYEKVRLLKIDTEGSEYQILYGSKLLNRVDEICGEIHDIVPDNHLQLPNAEMISSKKYDSDSLIEFLKENGFSVHTYYPNNWKNCRAFRAINLTKK